MWPPLWLQEFSQVGRHVLLPRRTFLECSHAACPMLIPGRPGPGALDGEAHSGAATKGNRKALEGLHLHVCADEVPCFCFPLLVCLRVG